MVHSFCPAAAQAQTNEWIGGYIGDWTDDEKWSGGTPTGGQAAINQAYATVNLTTQESIGSGSLAVGTNNNNTRNFFNIGIGSGLTLGSLSIGASSSTVGNGSVSVSGNGSYLTVGSTLSVAEYGGTAALSLTNGARLTADSVRLGTRAGADATVTISNAEWVGAGTYPTASVGGAGNAVLNIQNQANVELYSLSVNAYHYTSPTAVGSGIVNVDNATLKLTGDLSIGSGDPLDSGTAEVHITNGASVTVSGANGVGVGRSGNTTNARITVSGSGSELLVEDAGGVAKSIILSHGELDVSDGGKVRGNLSVGTGAGAGTTSRDSVVSRVTGIGSEIHHAGEMLQIGYYGEGRQIVSDGGVLKVGADGTGVIAVGIGKTASHPMNPNPPSTGTGILQIGEGGKAGTILASEIRGGGDKASGSGGDATVIFNHNEERYVFSTKLLDGGNALTPGSFRVEHDGPGTTVLTEKNTYHSGTTVRNGTLLVEGTADYLSDEFGTFVTASGTGLGSVVVEAGGVLGGGGDIGGATTIDGTLLFSHETGSLAFFDDLTLNSGSTVRLELSSFQAIDSITIDGDFSMAGRIEIAFVDGFQPESDFDIKLFDHLHDDNLDYTLSFQFGVDGLSIGQSGLYGANLDVAVVPEPGSLALLALGAGALGWGLRRRKNRLSAASRPASLEILKS